MPRETKADKATRLLTAAHVEVIRCDARGIWALVRGDSGVRYKVKRTRSRPDARLVDWCDCDALGECSHILAVRRIYTG